MGDFKNKLCLKWKQRGFPITKTDEGTAGDDTNIWQLASRWWTERGRWRAISEANMCLSLTGKAQAYTETLQPKSSLVQDFVCLRCRKNTFNHASSWQNNKGNRLKTLDTVESILSAHLQNMTSLLETIFYNLKSPGAAHHRFPILDTFLLYSSLVLQIFLLPFQAFWAQLMMLNNTNLYVNCNNGVSLPKLQI